MLLEIAVDDMSLRLAIGERNIEHAKTKLSMPVMTVAGEASAGAELEEWIGPLVEDQRYEIIEDCGHYRS